ncbi:F0F1 ATP synthase subunit A [Erysipelotrichaceae bacterium OH741_COT-311]|nr:F0F1 ATP synthase subunit A [Erysipelotrichaceae bacterium OH741_COT-311]
MTLTLQKEVVSIVLITGILCILCVIVGNQIKKSNPLEKPKGIVFLGVSFVSKMESNVETIINKKYAKRLGPYVASLAAYLLVSNISGLFGFHAPTANYSVTLTLAFITWIMVQVVSIKENGLKSYLHGFIEPFAFLLIPNIFGRLAPLISMSLRLFGNILSGTIILTLVYSFTSYISSLLLGVFHLEMFNFIGPLITPVLHGYFDLFSGFIQTIIFITLTMVFISNELPNE